jgi:hypothetical protein
MTNLKKQKNKKQKTKINKQNDPASCAVPNIAGWVGGNSKRR